MELIKFIQKLNVSFTAEEKEACLPVVELMSELADLMWMEGFLAFADSELIGDDAFLSAAASLLYDGLWRDEIMEHLQLMMLSDNKTGAEQLRRLLVMTGVYYMYSGVSPWQVKRILMAALGAEYLLEHDTIMRKTAPDPAKVRDYLDAEGEYDECCSITKERDEFRSLFYRMNDPTIQRVLREFRESTPALALKGIDDGDIRRQIYKNLSVNRRIQMINAADRHFRQNRGSGLVKNAQTEIIKKIHELDEKGMIFIDRSRVEREKREQDKARKKVEESLAKILAEIKELKTGLEDLA